MLFVGTSIIHPSTEGVFLLCNILDLLIYSFKVIYDQTEQVFVVKDDQGEDITEELEDTTSLRGTMYSVFWYASSRY